ncbi:MAG: NAD(P)H-dependent oxidoreductase [Deltaproteobacteria bacterium]|nr:NAD(P)H-dependent oxidoreductase [Deltaproteobacteria bacterium]
MRKRTTKVTALSGSIRSRYPVEHFNRKLPQLKSFAGVYEHIYSLSSKNSISNTEGIVIAASFGAMEQGCDIDLFRLVDLFPREPDRPISPDACPSLESSIRACQGLIIGTPVYFGDRSSLVESAFDLIAGLGYLPLKGKVAGFVSVGAKRNGGQETTNVLGLQVCLSLGANLVGNGPPTSQYGGTAVAGNPGAILDDNFGLQTSYGTGSRVAVLSQILPIHELPSYKPRVMVLYPKRPTVEIQERIEHLVSVNAEIDAVFLEDFKLGRCLGCIACPNPTPNESVCVQTDDMVEIRERMLRSEGMLIVDAPGRRIDGAKYQIFVERTRSMRRNNFELSNLPIGLIQFSSVFSGSLFFLRGTNFALRHNAIMIGPGFRGTPPNHRCDDNDELAGYIDHFVDQVIRYRPMRLDCLSNLRYEAVGYL